MGKRLLGVLLMVLFALAAAAPALAVEAEGEAEHEELPTFEEVGSGSEISQEFRPEPYEQPSVFRGILYPLMVIAGVAVLVVLGLYLLWQPRFSQEREAKKKR